MRDYGKVSPQFWIGKTGKSLRGNAETQLLALYLMTSPHANMIGVYHCPIAYMAHETGLTIEGASKALQSLVSADFCTFDAEDEYVFVHQFASHQVGENLKVTDKRCAGVENELAKLPKNECYQAFTLKYADAFHLKSSTEKPKKTKPLRSPLQAPSKPETETETEAEAETGAELSPNPQGGFEDFWECWPKNERKQDKAKCEAKWIREELGRVKAEILADVEAKKLTKKWREGFVEAPMVYLNNRRWEDGSGTDVVPDLKYGSDEYFEFHRKQSWWADAGFGSVWEAVSSRCNHKNFHLFRDGQKIKEAA